MDPISEDNLRKIREVLVNADIANTMNDIENALGWVVITNEYEIDRLRIYGLFDEPAAAMECASAVERFRRAEFPADEDDWSVGVYPLLPP